MSEENNKTKLTLEDLKKMELTDDQIELITGGTEDFGEEYNRLIKELSDSVTIFLFGTGKIDREALGKRIKEAFARVLEIRLENGAEPIEPLNIDGINIE